MSTNHRRAARGYTWDKCPGCESEPDPSGYGRPKDSVCDECLKMLNEARDRRAFLARQNGKWNQKWYGHNRMTHWNPYYYVGTHYGHNAEPDTRELQQAFVDVIFAVASDEKEAHGQYSQFYVKQKGDKTGIDGVVLDTQKYSSREGLHNAVLLSPAARDAINKLHLLISAMLPAAYQAGIIHGRSMLFQLAAGELSQSEFDASKPKGTK